MKHMKRKNIYQHSNYNVTFDPTTKDAFSYRWWRFVAVVDGVLIFNSYRYSVTTAKHQKAVRGLMDQLGLKIDAHLQLPRGIRHDQTLAELYTEAEETLCDQFLAEESKRITRNEKAAQRRLAKRQAADAQFKANLDSITFADIEAHRAVKLQLVK